MKKLLLLVPIAFICTSLISDKPLTNTNAFAIELYKTLAQNNSNNLVFSPYSISQAMAMTYEGAANETKVQMQEVLSFPVNENEIGVAFQQMNTSLQQSSDSVNLSIANGLWAQKDYRFQKSFINTSKQNYNAPVRGLDFKKAKTRKKAAKEINKWVSENTDGNIDKLIKANDLNKLTRMVLTNAIWFKANWAHGFIPEKTKMLAFKNLDGLSVSTEMMQQQANFNYYKGRDFQVIQLPYCSGNLSMVIVLPTEEADFSDVERNLSWKTLSAINSKMVKTEIDLLLPKFKLESELQLKKAFKNMGLTLPFSDSADFSGMTGHKELKIDKVLHKATIDVSETGTEASAATAVVMVRKTAFKPPVKFHANRPFVYYIIDQESDQLLFLGHFVQAK